MTTVPFADSVKTWPLATGWYAGSRGPLRTLGARRIEPPQKGVVDPPWLPSPVVRLARTALRSAR